MGHGITSSIAAIRQVVGTDPAANTELSEVVPADCQWTLLGLSVPLVQGITQTPQPILQILTAADAQDEIQALAVDAGAVAGSFKLRFTPPARYAPLGAGPFTTAAIPAASAYTAGDIQAALRAIAGAGLDTVTVVGGASPFAVTFTGGVYGGKDVPLLEVIENTLEDNLADPVDVEVTLTTAGRSGGIVYEGFGASAAQAVSTTCRYSWAVGLPLSAPVGATTNVHATAPLPEDLVLGPGYRIRTSTLGKGANSDYGAPSILVVEHG